MKKDIENKKKNIKKEEPKNVNKKSNKNKVVKSTPKKEENLSLTKQQKFNFDTNELEDEERTPKKKVTNKKVVVVEKKVYPVFLITILMIIILFLIINYLYHFKNFDHNKVKIEKVEVVKKLDNNYVFLGDSITYMYNLDKYYEGMPVVNSGGDGNQTSDILSDMSNRIYRYNPTKIFILIGTNDIIYNKTEEQIVNNIKKIIENIHKNRPDCKVYVESIYPINDTDNEKISMHMVKNRKNSMIRKINDELKLMSSDLDFTYINMYDKLTDEDGNLKLEYTKEGLHMTEEGYEVITKVIKSYIEEN